MTSFPQGLKSVGTRLAASLKGSWGTLLACQSDGFLFRAAIVAKAGEDIRVGPVAESRAMDFAKAVEEAVSQIKEAGKPLPRQAVLVTSSVVPALLDLPVDPAAPRPPQQMEELIRWEIEPLIGQQNDLWVIGAILQGRGYLSNEQRREVAVAVELATSAGGGRGATRFGEMAIEEGFITREQLDECLLLQEKLVVADDELICGWAPQTVSSGEDGERHAWFACAISATLRRNWVGAFARNKLNLKWLYPMVGATMAAIEDGEAADHNRVLLEIHPEQLACFRIVNRNLAAMQVEPRVIGQINVETCIDVCHDQMRPNITRLHITPEGRPLAAELSARLNRDVVTLPQSKDALAGAAAHAMGCRPGHILPRIQAAQRDRNLARNPDVLRYGAVAAMVVAAIGVEAKLRLDALSHEQELRRIEAEYEERQEEQSKVSKFVSEVGTLEQDVKEAEDRLLTATYSLTIMENILLARARMVPGMLNGLRDAVSDEVVIDRLSEEEGRRGYFALEGWALNDTAAQLFVNKLNRVMGKWNLSVVDERITRATGRLGLSGYKVTLKLVPTGASMAGR